MVVPKSCVILLSFVWLTVARRVKIESVGLLSAERTAAIDQEALGAPVDLSGEWQLSEVKGSPYDYFKKVGFPTMTVMAMKAAKYGVGSYWEKIDQKGNDITHTKYVPNDPITLKYKVGQKQMTSLKGPDGKTYKADIKWEGKSLVIKIHRDDGKIITSKDKLEGDKRVVWTEFDGKEMTSIFIRKKA